MEVTKDRSYASSSGLIDARLLPRPTRLLFLVFVIYIVVPIIDVPLLGLSLSAPILFLIFLEIFFRPRGIQIEQYGIWITIGYAFMFGLLVSLAGNAVFNSVVIDAQDLLTLVRYGYWVVVFLTTIIIVSHENYIITLIGHIIAIGVIFLALLRLYEAIAFGRWGAWTAPQFSTQNGYGIQFSTFFSFALVLSFVLNGWSRWMAAVVLILAIAAVAGNGSRSSWIAVTINVVVFLTLYAITQRGGIWQAQRKIIVIIVVLLIVISLVPTSLLDPVLERFNTFNTIEQDKTYVIRQVLVQKGLRLFEESPLFGVGIGRFTKTSTNVDIPDVLSYANQSHFDNRSSHNSYIALLAETGLAGLLPFILLHFLLIIQGLPSAIKLARNNEIWALAAFSGYVGMSIHLWSLSGLTGTMTWFMYGLVAGMVEREKASLTPDGKTQ